MEHYKHRVWLFLLSKYLFKSSTAPKNIHHIPLYASILIHLPIVKVSLFGPHYATGHHLSLCHLGRDSFSVCIISISSLIVWLLYFRFIWPSPRCCKSFQGFLVSLVWTLMTHLVMWSNMSLFALFLAILSHDTSLFIS